MRFEFEWGIAQDGATFYVRERLVGTELVNFYPAPSQQLAEAIVKARRAFVNRTITSRIQAMQVFEPRPNLEALSLLQQKGHLDS